MYSSLKNPKIPFFGIGNGYWMKRKMRMRRGGKWSGNTLVAIERRNTEEREMGCRMSPKPGNESAF